MKYKNDYEKLKNAIASVETKTEIDNIELYKFEFKSSSYNILPGKKDYYCELHDIAFKDCYSFSNDVGIVEKNILVNDISVEENMKFEYYLLKLHDNKPIKNITFMFHGFNEKYWEKYLPWAKAICEGTESAIILFPIAFHMHRAPLYWSEKRKMFALSEKRKAKFPNIINSTLSNLAISMRLHSMPQRFIWSGLQTYYDIVRFIEYCKNGKQELIDKNFTFNVFAYSIGGLLAEILKLSNHNNYFSDAKICMFCSGAVFNRLSPVSKYILDSEANVALYSYLIEHFDTFLKRDDLLRHYINEGHIEGKVFLSMLDYQKMRDFRESLFRKYEDHIYAITLKNDTVIPSFEVFNTLNGAFRDINIPVEEMDFDYKYIHENPFPTTKIDPLKVDKNFEMVFDKVCNFLNK